MYSVQGSELFTYFDGSKAGPFDLAGLLALVNGGGGGGSPAAARRRRLLQQGGSLSISSLDYDGQTLWVVLSNG